jgi:hypothetical protein
MTQNSVTGVKGEIVNYSSCYCNCGSDSHCVFKVHLKDGIVAAVEPDDRYNPGSGSWYEPDESGVDFGPSASTLSGGDYESCIGPAKAATVTQIEKYAEKLPVSAVRRQK